MSKTRRLIRLSLVLLAMYAATGLAGEGPTPSGKVSIDTKSVAAGVGVSWGDGKLSFEGKEYDFSIDGLTLVDFGISKASAMGDVYNLTELPQFEGNYVAGEAGFTLAGGIGGISMRNQNGVVMHLRSVSEGAKLQLGPSGMSVKLRK